MKISNEMNNTMLIKKQQVVEQQQKQQKAPEEIKPYLAVPKYETGRFLINSRTNEVVNICYSITEKSDCLYIVRNLQGDYFTVAEGDLTDKI
jgi:hypothetical protein